MQLKDFYQLLDINVTDNDVVAHISINKNHEIFKGHFPGNPVTPGVCMMQIIKELTEQVVDEKLIMTSSSNVKFMAIINPEINPDLKLNLKISKTEEGFTVKNITSFEDTIALKLTSKFKIKN